MVRQLGRLFAVVVAALGAIILASTPALAETARSVDLVLNSWPVILAGAVGIASTHLTELFTQKNAPQWVKSFTNLALSSLGGVLLAIQLIPGRTWKDYVGEVMAVWFVSMFTHWSGATTWVQEKTASIGVGGNAKPLVPSYDDTEEEVA